MTGGRLGRTAPSAPLCAQPVAFVRIATDVCAQENPALCARIPVVFQIFVYQLLMNYSRQTSFLSAARCTVMDTFAVFVLFFYSLFLSVKRIKRPRGHGISDGKTVKLAL